MNILLTGGAGYIGSHTAKELLCQGHTVIVLDNLSTGFEPLIPKGAVFVKGDIADCTLVSQTIQKYRIESVLHFAAFTSVEESVKDPFKYYENNFTKAAVFLKTVTDHGVQHFVFSSTAAVYGMTAEGTVNEQSPTRPANPYGQSKLMFETLLKDVALATPLHYVILRYFNVAGAHPSYELGQVSKNATHLIKRGVEVACGTRESISIFGTDYPTKDGTGVRDYIHVQDLVRAHLLALDYLSKGGKNDIFNCGYGFGYSVKEVIREISSLAQAELLTRTEGRRAGDVAALVADSTKLKNILGWKPEFANLSSICNSALQWEKRRPVWEKFL